MRPAIGPDDQPGELAVMIVIIALLAAVINWGPVRDAISSYDTPTHVTAATAH